MISNEEFLASLAEDYPNVDWDNLPDLESSPDVFVVHFKEPGRFNPRYCQIHKEYETEEEAKRYITELMPKVFPEAYDVEIRRSKADHLTWLHIFRELRNEVLSGEKVFPMYLP